MTSTSKLGFGPSMECGFSVLEMLTCLLLTGTLLAFVVTSAAGWIRFQDRGKSELSTIEAVSLGIEALHIDVENARHNVNSFPKANVAISGNSTDLLVTTSNSGRISLIRYTANTVGGLYRHEAQIDHISTSEPMLKSSIFPPSINARFAYVDENGSVKAEWTASAPPRAIHVELYWTWHGKERSEMVTLRPPHFAPIACAQTTTLAQCELLLRKGSSINPTERQAVRNSRSRRGR